MFIKSIGTSQQDRATYIKVWYEDTYNQQNAIGFVSSPKDDITKILDNQSSIYEHVRIPDVINGSRYCRIVKWENPATYFNSPFEINSTLRVNSDFGWRCLQKGSNFHVGIDITDANITGRNVHAVGAGKIIKSVRNQNRSNKGYGNHVIIDHGNNRRSLYGHLSKTKVQVGEWVNCKQVIGLVGNTGHSYGPHLHLEFQCLSKPIPLPYSGMKKIGIYINPYQVLTKPKIKMSPYQTDKCKKVKK